MLYVRAFSVNSCVNTISRSAATGKMLPHQSSGFIKLRLAPAWPLIPDGNVPCI